MDNDMKHDEPKPMPHHDPHMMGMWKSWSSWQSPVGLGIFFLTTALAAAIALYALLNLLGAVMSLARPAPTYSYPSDMPMTQTVPEGTPADSAGGMMAQ